VLKLNFQGGVVDTVRTLPGHLEVNHLAYQTGNKLAIGGVNSHETYMYIRARQMWLHTNKLNDDPVVNVADVALMEVVPRAPVLIDTINATSLTPVLYSLSGGDFEARIFNNSAVVLKEVAICVSFDYIFKGCLERAQKKITYTGLHVAPGEATTLDFGNISAPKQWGLPSAMCFYTSSPNALPDDNPNNDKACYEIATVNTYAPEPDHLLIWPNPASTWIYIKLPSEELNNTHWKLLDNIGRVLQSGEIETGASILSINTVGVARGTYWVMINNRVAQVVIQ
jgi:hypothetical protein